MTIIDRQEGTVKYIPRLWVTALALVGLSLGAAALPSQAVESSAATACPTGWGSTPKSRAVSTTASLANARTARHECFDRIVIDIPGVRANGLGYSVTYVDQLHQHGSGRPIPLSGSAVIEVVVNAPAYDVSSGKPTYHATPGLRLPGVSLTGYRTFRDARYAGSFEGQTQIGLGIRARLPFRVLPLDGRVVVDVAHNWTGS